MRPKRKKIVQALARLKTVRPVLKGYHQDLVILDDSIQLLQEALVDLTDKEETRIDLDLILGDISSYSGTTHA